MLASTDEDAAVGEMGGGLTPGDVVEGSRASSLGPFPLQLGSWKPPRPGADQSHSPEVWEHSTGGLPLRGIWMEKWVRMGRTDVVAGTLWSPGPAGGLVATRRG